MQHLPCLRPTRRAALLGLALGLAGAAQAQQRAPLYVGLTTGLNLATYTGPGTAGIPTGWQPGAALGLRVAYPLARLAAVQLEAGYAQKGVRQSDYQAIYNVHTYSGSSTYHAALGYLEVPLLLSFGPGAAGQARGLYATLGPQLSLALHKREWVRTTSPDDEETLDTDHRSLTPVATGYVAGLGYQFGNGLGAEVRYSGDFDPVYRPGNDAGSYYAGASNQLRNGGWRVQLSFRLRGGGGGAATTSGGRPLPPPATDPQVVLREHPGLRRVVQVLTVLSWLDAGRGPRPGCGPVYGPAPGRPAPAPSQPRFPMPAPRPLPGRPLPPR